MKVLLVDDNEDLVDVLTILLSSEFAGKLDIKAVNSVIEAKDILASDPEIDFIISDYSMPKENADVLFRYNKENKNLPFILFTVFDYKDCKGLDDLLEANPLNSYVQKNYDGDKLFRLILNLINGGKEPKTEEYIKLPLGFFKINNAPVDNLYLKIGNEKYVKIIEEGKNSSELLEHYSEKGIKDVYLPRASVGNFLDLMFQFIHSHSKQLDTRESIELFDLSFSIDIKGLEEIGLKRHHVDLAKTSVQAIQSKISSNKALAEAFLNLEKTGQFSRDLSLLTLFLCSPIVNGLDWQGPQTMEKLGMAAFFQNICYTGDDLEKIEFLNMNEVQEFEDFQKKTIVEHPRKVYDLLESVSSISSDTLNIISEHHELPDGKGYPVGLTYNNISGLSAVFIVAHNLAGYLLNSDVGPSRVREFIESLGPSYEKGSFKKPIKILSDLVK